MGGVHENRFPERIGELVQGKRFAHVLEAVLKRNITFLDVNYEVY